MANGGQDRVIQPHDSVLLSGIQSKDDNKIVSYNWQMITLYPGAIIEVSKDCSANFMSRVQFGHQHL